MLAFTRCSIFQFVNWPFSYKICTLVPQFYIKKWSKCFVYSCLNTNIFHKKIYTSSRNYVYASLCTYKAASTYKNRSSRTRTTIIKNEVAYKLLRHLKEEISKSDILIEVDPGNGVLTKLLVYAVNNKIILFQPSISLQRELLHRFKKKRRNIIFSPLNIHDAQKYFYRSEVLQNHSEYIDFMQTLQQNYSESSKLKLIGAISSQSLLYTIMINFSHRNMFYGMLNMSLLVYVSSKIYSSIMKDSKSFKTWRLGIFANLCFDIEYLGSDSSDCFETTFNSKLIKSDDDNDSYFHLLKFTPRDSIGSCENIKEGTKELAHFFYFVNYFIRVHSATPFLAALESFIPSIGKELIKNGFKVYGRPHCLTNDEWVIAFNVFSSHPNYLSNPIIKMMSDDFSKLGYFESDFEDDDDDEKVDASNLEKNIS